MFIGDQGNMSVFLIDDQYHVLEGLDTEASFTTLETYDRIDELGITVAQGYLCVKTE